MSDVGCACAAPRYLVCSAEHPYRSDGCGHLLAEHTAGMRCRVCRSECGIAPRARPRARPASSSSTPGHEQLTLA